jgi:hypothetical protein
MIHGKRLLLLFIFIILLYSYSGLTYNEKNRIEKTPGLSWIYNCDYVEEKLYISKKDIEGTISIWTYINGCNDGSITVGYKLT